MHSRRESGLGLPLLVALLLPLVSLAGDDISPAVSNRETVLVTGATGRLGQFVIREVRARGYRVRAITRDKVAAERNYGADYEWVEADLLQPESIRSAMRGIDRVISAAGSTRPDGPQGPQFVDYEGVVGVIDAAVEANVDQFILVSSIGVTQRFHLLNLTFGDVLIYKKQSEDYLRASGLDYTIVRPGGLRPGGRSGSEGMALEQGDKKGGSYILIPDLAVLIAWLLDNPDGDGKTFEVLSDPVAPPMAWQAMLPQLVADP